MSNRPPFVEVPPAVVPANLDRADRTREIQASRTRQATFERGVALALVTSMQEQVAHLATLAEGLRWLIVDDDVKSVTMWLENLRGDILRAERIEERRAGGR